MLREVYRFRFPKDYGGVFPTGRPVYGGYVYTVDDRNLVVGVVDLESDEFTTLSLDVPSNAKVRYVRSVASGDELYVLLEVWGRKVDRSILLYRVKDLRVEKLCSLRVPQPDVMLQDSITEAFLIDIDFDGEEEFVFTSYKRVFTVENDCLKYLFDFTGCKKLTRVMDIAVDSVSKVIYTTYLGWFMAGRREILSFNSKGEFIKKYHFGSLLAHLDILTRTYLIKLIRKNEDIYMFLFNNPRSSSIFAVKNLSKNYLWYLKPYTYPYVFLDVDGDSEEEIFLAQRNLTIIDDIFTPKPKVITVAKKFAEGYLMEGDLTTDGERIYLIDYKYKWGRDLKQTLYVFEPSA